MIFVITISTISFVLLFLGLGCSLDNQREIIKQNQQIIKLLQNKE